jgi:predicted nucleic acid-binding Zn ribbon protein
VAFPTINLKKKKKNKENEKMKRKKNGEEDKMECGSKCGEEEKRKGRRRSYIQQFLIFNNLLSRMLKSFQPRDSNARASLRF